MSRDDTRPAWLLRKQARISRRRLDRFGRPPDVLALAVWWGEIVEAAADLALEPGKPDEWQAWPQWEQQDP